MAGKEWGKAIGEFISSWQILLQGEENRIESSWMPCRLMMLVSSLELQLFLEAFLYIFLILHGWSPSLNLKSYYSKDRRTINVLRKVMSLDSCQWAICWILGSSWQTEFNGCWDYRVEFRRRSQEATFCEGPWEIWKSNTVAIQLVLLLFLGASRVPIYLPM